MASNFKVFGSASTNVYTQSEYTANDESTNGFQPNTPAHSQVINTALKSSSLAVAAIFQALTGSQTTDVGLDSSVDDLTTFVKNGVNQIAGSTVDSSLSTTSTNAVQNKVVTSALNNKVTSGQIATSSVAGLVKPVSTLSSVSANAVSTDTGKYYQIQMTTDGKMYVNVPWVNTTYSVVTQTTAGLMSAADKIKLDGITGTGSYILPIATSDTLGGVKSSTTGITSNRDYYIEVLTDGTMKVNVPWINTTYSNGTGLSLSSTTFSLDTTYTATTSRNGLMSSTDKTKLNGIATGANNYSLPTASSTTLGGIKTGYTTSGTNYKLNINSSGNGYVNVPRRLYAHYINMKGTTSSYDFFVSFTIFSASSTSYTYDTIIDYFYDNHLIYNDNGNNNFVVASGMIQKSTYLPIYSVILLSNALNLYGAGAYYEVETVSTVVDSIV